MAALDRALALAERHDAAVGVGEELHLDVPGTLEVALREDGAVAERRLGLAAGRRRALGSSSAAERTTRMPRPPPPAAALTSSG